MKQIIFILTLSILCGCTQTETKKVVSTYKNGQPEIVNYFLDKDDTLTYRKEVFDESGKQNYVGNFVKGTKEGVWTWWYENGNKKDQCKYVNGKEIDTIFHWFDNGQLKQFDVLHQGKISAENTCTICCNVTETKYYENGNLEEIYTKSDDLLQGKCANYSVDGSWKILTFKNGSLWGPTIEHLDSNQIIVVGQYENGKETGLWKWFDKDSILTLSKVYSNGDLNGEQIEYYPNGKIKQKGIVFEGEYQGEVFYFDSTEKLTKTAFYKNDKLQRTGRK